MQAASTLLILGVNGTMARQAGEVARGAAMGREEVQTRQELADRARLESAGCILADIDILSPDHDVRVLSEIQRRVVLPIVLVVETVDAKASRAALQAGLFDVLPASADADELAGVVDRAVNHCVQQVQVRQAMRRLRKRLVDHRVRLSDAESQAFDLLLGEECAPAEDTNSAVSRPAAGKARRARVAADTPHNLQVDRDVAEQIEDLSPRLRQTLDYLLQGNSEKQVAFEMGLSRHTVHDYVKALHKQFEVQSRGELIAKCLIAQNALTRG